MITKFKNYNKMNKYFEIIRKYNLEKYFGILLKENTANDAPYHNMYHTLCVMYNSYQICISDYQLSNNEIRTILIAALFHDFGHSMGKLKDDENVKNAIKAFDYYSEEHNNEEIKSIIQATQYPYIDIQESIYTIIIRDADMMQIFADNYFQQNIISLGVEFNKDTLGSLEMSLNFFKSIKFNTKYAIAMFEKEITTKINDIQFMIDCYNV